MVASAERIDFISHDINFEPGNVGPTGTISSRSTLTVHFRVFRRGPSHVSGLIYTINFWRTPKTALAEFQGFQGDDELWQAIVVELGTAPTPLERVSFDSPSGVHLLKTTRPFAILVKRL
jgi:hypothetical protein